MLCKTQQMNSMYIKVYSGSMIIVTNIVAKLENAGIVPVIKDESESGRLAGFGSAIQCFQEIYVHQDETENAIVIIERTIGESNC
mgnify:FL=1|jgi:hypothetical protein